MSSPLKFALCLSVCLLFSAVAAEENNSVSQAVAVADHQLLSFEQNQGQAAAEFDYLARGRGYIVLVNRDSATLLLPKKSSSNHSTSMVRIRLLGTRVGATARAFEPLLTRTNYLIGNDRRHWRTNAPNYGRVAYEQVYPGVDLIYYGRDGELEFDFAVAPGADPHTIHLAVEGAKVSASAAGDVVLRANGARVTLRKPRLYQFDSGHKRSVKGRYAVDRRNRVSFVIGSYNKTTKLVIDPVLAYSMMIGGGWSDYGRAVAVDNAGYTYMAGTTDSANFPVTSGAFDSSCGTDGVCNQYPSFRHPDIFVAKLTSRGTRTWVTYLGGSGDDNASGIAVDGNGNAYVTGDTSSLDYPASPLSGAPPKQTPFAFVTKLNPSGSSIVYSVRFCSQCSATGIVVNSTGEAFVAGGTSGSFLATSNAFQGTARGGTDGFVAKLNAAGTSLVYGTFLGGGLYDSVAAIAVDSSGNAYIAGLTLSTDFPTTSETYEPSPKIMPSQFSPSYFVTKLNSTGSNLAFSTYFTGPGPGGLAGIAIDAAGNSYVTGASSSRNNFPTTSGAYQQTHHSLFDAYITKFDSAGSRLVYSTLLGGGANDFAGSIVVDHGDAIVTGGTASQTFPTTVNALQRVNRAPYPIDNCFITKLNATGSALLYSSYLGGSEHSSCTGSALGPFGNVYVTGWTIANDFPTTPGAFKTPLGQFDNANAFAAQIMPLCPLKAGNLTVTICNPGDLASVTSPVTIMAGTHDTLPVKSIEILVDGAKVYQAKLSAVMVRWPMSAGTHRVTVRARDYVNQPFSASVNVSVGP